MHGPINEPIDVNKFSSLHHSIIDSKESMWCEACREPVIDETRFTAYWDKVERRVSFCSDCLGEIFFDVLPVVTGPTPDTPSGRGSPLGEPDPWHENAVRAIEEQDDRWRIVP